MTVGCCFCPSIDNFVCSFPSSQATRRRAIRRTSAACRTASSWASPSSSICCRWPSTERPPSAPQRARDVPPRAQSRHNTHTHNYCNHVRPYQLLSPGFRLLTFISLYYWVDFVYFVARVYTCIVCVFVYYNSTHSAHPPHSPESRVANFSVPYVRIQVHVFVLVRSRNMSFA